MPDSTTLAPPALQAQEPEADDLLRLLVNVVNSTRNDDVVVDLKLTIGGTIVTGSLVPNSVWMRRQEQALAAIEDGCGGFSELFALAADSIEDWYSQTDGSEGTDYVPTTYIHL
ncbi:MAG: hypothetical protein WCP28_15005, partial [Actinomycetes bacterium]